jgi:ribose 5-phosphate isomerase A
VDTADLAALAAKALEWVPPGARIGLGSGRTTQAFIRALGEKVRQGFSVRGVPTSSGSARLAQEFGIPLDELNEVPLEITIDGADEVEPRSLNLIKGWGGALVRERIVAAASRKQLILVTPEKLVERLGQRGKLPVEVIPFAEPFVRRKLAELPGNIRPERRSQDGQTFVTDNGNWILDCALAPIEDPQALADSLRAIAGVVDAGLFLGTASTVLVAEKGAVRELHRP